MAHTSEWYGNWEIVIASIVLASFIFTVFLAKPKKLDWRSFGLTEAFIISLFTEMFGIPFTIYILTSISHINIVPSGLTGHLLATFLDLYGILDLETGVLVVMTISIIMIIIGLVLLIGGWIQVYKYKDELAVKGLYSVVRHPQYLGIIILMTAFIIQWPTIPTLIMFPILLYVYYRQALKEEAEMISRFGDRYLDYMSKVPRFNFLKGLLSNRSSKV
jgi:protein-S-isoprenylcysteine O-methyltransferase Ste14